MRRRIGRIVSGEYQKVDEEVFHQPSDYFHGVAPSDLARLDERQLFLASDRLHESVASGVGTKEERAWAAEALKETYRERYRRRATIR
jgi:hypothetical protein